MATEPTEPKQKAGTFDPKTGRPIPGGCPICGATPATGGGLRCRPPDPAPPKR